MREQEEMMMKKYGGMKPKKKGLLQTKVRVWARPWKLCARFYGLERCPMLI